jgi:hypothetical protein
MYRLYWPPLPVHIIHGRIRRAGLKLLASVALPSDPPTASRMVVVLLTKARDKDSLVRLRAVGLLVGLPLQALLSAGLQKQEWIWLLHCCMEQVSSGKVCVSVGVCTCMCVCACTCVCVCVSKGLGTHKCSGAGNLPL